MGSPFAFAPSDGSLTSKTSLPIYDPAFLYEIPVVVHVISDTAGVGDLPDSEVITQTARLNQDFSGQTFGLGRDNR